MRTPAFSPHVSRGVHSDNSRRNPIPRRKLLPLERGRGLSDSRPVLASCPLLYRNSSHFSSSFFFVAFSPSLLLLAAPWLFQTTLPRRGFCTRWGFRKSLCQLVRVLAREAEQPSTPSAVSARKKLAAICRFVLPANCSSPGLLSHWAGSCMAEPTSLIHGCYR